MGPRYKHNYVQILLSREPRRLSPLPPTFPAICAKKKSHLAHALMSMLRVHALASLTAHSPALKLADRATREEAVGLARQGQDSVQAALQGHHSAH